MGKKRIILYIVVPILIILVTIGILISLVLYKGNILVIKLNPVTNIINKAISVENTGGTIELKEEDVNGILDFCLKKNFKNTAIKGLYANMESDEIQLYIPVNYKKVNLLLYAKGNLSYKNNKIVFLPKEFKIGKIKLPVKYVIGNVKKYFKNNNLIFNDNSVEINSSVIPFKFSFIKIKPHMLEAGIEKVTAKDENKPVQQGATSSTSNPSTLVDENKALLSRASNQLNGVYSSLSTSAEKQIISSMQSVVRKMIDDTNYPYKAEADQTRGNYNKLTEIERDNIKNAIMDNMDMQTLKKLKSTFGF